MKVIISGATGAMGQVLADCLRGMEDHELVGGYAEEANHEADYLIVDCFEDLEEQADVLIDFSLPATLEAVLDYGLAKQLPLVIATTGYSEEEEDKIQQASQSIPIFFAKNMSVGINMMEKMLEELSRVLQDFDIEIVEKHHRYKKDSPSGTAKMLVKACQQGRPSLDQVVEGRSGHYEGRPREEIGVSAVRGGTIVGEHSAIFAGEDEVIEVTHTAQSKKVFAHGAIQAAEFLITQEPGFYSMNDLLGG